MSFLRNAPSPSIVNASCAEIALSSIVESRLLCDLVFFAGAAAKKFSRAVVTAVLH